MQKLTLRMEAEEVQKAKEYAAIHGKSLSQLVADYFDSLTENAADEEALPPLTQSLRGILSNAEGTEDKDNYKKYLEGKYL
ncbi:DUF6364 family protein [Endozoicomonas sp.]|uniref:DUF6364 family protein n=1 Tax=Endozoicomonas sp. TaxID=1892382 RepID=UPI00383ADF54